MLLATQHMEPGTSAQTSQHSCRLSPAQQPGLDTLMLQRQEHTSFFCSPGACVPGTCYSPPSAAWAPRPLRCAHTGRGTGPPPGPAHCQGRRRRPRCPAATGRQSNVSQCVHKVVFSQTGDDPVQVAAGGPSPCMHSYRAAVMCAPSAAVWLIREQASDWQLCMQACQTCVHDL